MQPVDPPQPVVVRPPPVVVPPTATFMASFGSYGSGAGEFMWPDSVAVDPTTGMIAVLDWGNHRVQVFYPNATFAFEIGARGQGPGEFFYPNGIAFGRDGTLIVADAGNHRVQMFRIE